MLTENEVVLLQLARADLLLERVAAQVDVGKQATVVELLLHLLRVAVDGGHDGDDEHLARAQPEGPLAGKVLREDTDHALEAAQHRSVDHDGTGVADRQFRVIVVRGSTAVILGRDVSELEPLRLHKVQLDRAALVVSPQRVVDGDIDLGAVKGTIARVELPLGADALREGDESFLELLLRQIP